MDDSQTAPAHRPWYRLHRSTWLLIPVAIAVVTVVVVPGEIGACPDRHSMEMSNWYNTGVVHGWPLPFLWRIPFGQLSDPSILPDTNPWNITDSVYRLNWCNLIVDLLVALGGIAGFTALFEWRRRKRSRFLQFTLRGLLACTTTVAILTAWYMHRRKASADLVEHVDRVRQKVWPMEPSFPLWVRNILGDETPSRTGLMRPRHPQVLWWNAKCGDDIRYAVEAFPTETTLIVSKAFTEENAAGIARIGGLESLESQELTEPDRRRFLVLTGKLPNLRRLLFSNEKTTPPSDDELSQIANVSSLEALDLENVSLVTERGFSELTKLKHLTELRIDHAKLTPATLNSLGKLTNLRRLSLTSSNVLDGDFSSLSRISGLEELEFSDVNLGENGLRQLQPLRQLRHLGLCGAHINATSLKRMATPTDDCPRPFPNLRSIDLQGGSEFKLSIASNLAALGSLERLKISSFDVDAEAIAALKSLPALRRLDVSGDQGSRSSKIILTRLQQELPNCRVEGWY